jgi:hypothetical protein
VIKRPKQYSQFYNPRELIMGKGTELLARHPLNPAIQAKMAIDQKERKNKGY